MIKSDKVLSKDLGLPKFQKPAARNLKAKKKKEEDEAYQLSDIGEERMTDDNKSGFN